MRTQKRNSLTRAKPENLRSRLEATRPADAVEPIAESLSRRVIGQDASIDSLVHSFARPLSGLRDPSRPLLTALLLGPTGVGKTETAKAVSSAVFGSDTAMTRINCEEFAHGHEVGKLLGSPPGYVGFQVEPLLSQSNLGRGYCESRPQDDGETEHETLADQLCTSCEEPISIVLFDEIEKAHPTVWNALLGVLDDGVLTLGNNDTTDFRSSIIFLTSNVGSREMAELLDGPRMGFGATEEDAGEPGADEDERLELAAKRAAERSFPPEFLNRMDQVLIYHALGRKQLERILDKFLAELHERALNQAHCPFLLRVSPEARSHLIEQGTDPRFGARPLRRAVEHELIDPLSTLIATAQVTSGDVIDVELDAGSIAFFRSSAQSSGLVA